MHADHLLVLQVGEAFADNDTVIIAKMDGTANDVPSSKFDVSLPPPSIVLTMA